MQNMKKKKHYLSSLIFFFLKFMIMVIKAMYFNAFP